MANLNSDISLQNEHKLIEISQKMLRAPSAEVLTQIEIREADRAFAKLLSRYDRWIWKQVRSKQVRSTPSLDLNDAYSAGLEGFQKAVATFDLTSGNALVSWAYPLVRGALGAVLYKEQRQAARIHKMSALASLTDEDELYDPYEQEEFYQSVQKLHQATLQLSETTQKIVFMRNEGIKFDAIGAEVGKSADAVRMAYNRAIAALSIMLTQEPSAECIRRNKSRVLQENGSNLIQKNKLDQTFMRAAQIKCSVCSQNSYLK